MALRTGNLVRAQEPPPTARPSIPPMEPATLVAISRCGLTAQSWDVGGCTRPRPPSDRICRAPRGRPLVVGTAKFCLHLGTNLDASLKRLPRTKGAVSTSVWWRSALIAHRLQDLDGPSIDISTRPRSALIVGEPAFGGQRQNEQSPNRVQAASILDRIGEPEDIPLLRSVARASKKSRSDSSLGRGLARRLAAKVVIEDQGRVEIHVGPSVIPGTDLRRKVLAMLCYLLTRSKFSATKRRNHRRALAGDGSRRRGQLPQSDRLLSSPRFRTGLQRGLFGGLCPPRFGRALA